MVPRTPILYSSPGIIETVSRSDRTLSYTIDAVYMYSYLLSNPIPMSTSAIVLELVVDDDCDILSIISVWYSIFQENESKKDIVLEK
jgi:hypothetical protein